MPFGDSHSEDNGSWVSGGFFNKKSVSQEFTIKNNPSRTNERADSDNRGSTAKKEDDNDSFNEPYFIDDATVDDEQQGTFPRRNSFQQPTAPESPQTQRSKAIGNTPDKISANTFGNKSAKTPPVDAAALQAQEDRLANNEFEERRAALNSPVMRRAISRGEAKAERLKRQYENMRPDEVERLLPKDIRQNKKGERESAKRWSSSFLADRQDSNSPRAKVSLIVSAEPVTELRETISELVSLRERSRIYIGEVLIVGADKVMRTDEKKFAIASQKILNAAISSLSESDNLDHLENAAIPKTNGYETLRSFLEKKGFGFSSFVSSEKVLGKYKVHSSPTWIISLQQNGRRVSHVLQGRPTLGGLFTSDGAFLPITEQRKVKVEVEASGEAKIPNTTQTSTQTTTEMFQPFSFQTDRSKVVQHESPYRGTAQFITDKTDYIYRYLPDIGSEDSK